MRDIYIDIMLFVLFAVMLWFAMPYILRVVGILIVLIRGVV